MSFGGQSSSSDSERGLSFYDRLYFSDKARGEYDHVKTRAREAEADPGGLAFMPTVNALLPVGKYGLHPNTTTGVDQLGRDMFSRASGSRAQRGFNTAYNLEGVTGDAVRMVAPTLIPLQTQYALARAQAAPALRAASFGYAKTPMDIISSLLAGAGRSTSEGMGFGLGISGIGEVGALGAAAASA